MVVTPLAGVVVRQKTTSPDPDEGLIEGTRTTFWYFKEHRDWAGMGQQKLGTRVGLDGEDQRQGTLIFLHNITAIACYGPGRTNRQIFHPRGGRPATKRHWGIQGIGNDDNTATAFLRFTRPNSKLHTPVSFFYFTLLDGGSRKQGSGPDDDCAAFRPVIPKTSLSFSFSFYRLVYSPFVAVTLLPPLSSVVCSFSPRSSRFFQNKLLLFLSFCVLGCI